MVGGGICKKRRKQWHKTNLNAVKNNFSSQDEGRVTKQYFVRALFQVPHTD